jgi:MoxR-like ATPase
VGDIQWLVKPALRHRIAGNYAAQASNLDSDRLIDILLESVPADKKYERPAA